MLDAKVRQESGTQIRIDEYALRNHKICLDSLISWVAGIGRVWEICNGLLT
jgi:hypothetical protein